MTRFLYLSPHLDDVVLSAGATISRRLAEGHELIVATVFSGPQRGSRTEEGRIYAARRDEDERAMAILSSLHSQRCRSLYLGLSDAPYRDAFYSGFKPIVHGPSSRAGDEQARGQLVAMLEHLLQTERPEVLLAPLAVGTHVDHRLVFEVATALDWEGELRFYEDLPYAFVPGAVDLRWTRLGSEALELRASSQVHTWPSLGFLEGYRDIQAPRRDVSRWRWKGQDYTQSAAPSSPQERHRRTRAIAAYQSQLAPLFDAGPDDALAIISTLYGHRAEIEWRPAERRAQASVVESALEES